jgi:rubrerythrin
MEWVCPICNGMDYIEIRCPACGHVLVDGGNLQDFYGPYSPYMEQNTYGNLEDLRNEGKCLHLLYCPQCGYDRRAAIQQVVI